MNGRSIMQILLLYSTPITFSIQCLSLSLM
nr:MAG TPA: hypothetical protein [Bacteriophage sp.]